jgi:hypothetical protein
MRDCSTRYPVRCAAAGHALSYRAAVGATEDRVFMPAMLGQEMIADILHCKITTRAFPVLSLV